MSKYKCIKPLYLDKYDEHGASTEEIMEVMKDSLWEVEECDYMHVAGRGAIRLSRMIDGLNGEWIEVYEDTLEAHFQEVG